MSAAAKETRRRGGWFRRFADAPWWVHVLATLGAVLVAAASVAAALYVDFVREKWASTTPSGTAARWCTGMEADEYSSSAG